MAITRNLFKATHIVFSDVNMTYMNVYPRHLGTEYIAMTTEGNVVENLPAGFGVVQSGNIYLQVSLAVNLLKNTDMFDSWYDRVLQNGFLPGKVTFFDDAQNEIEVHSISLGGIGEMTGDGQTASVPFTVNGIIYVNQEIATQLGVI